VNGTVGEVDGSTVVLSRAFPSDALVAFGGAPDPGSRCAVEFDAGAKLWRSGPAKLSDFEPEDEVIVYVHSTSSGLVAWAMEPMYVAVAANVESRSGNDLRTDQGTIEINDYTVVRPTPTANVSSADQISTGNRVGATCRLDPRSRRLVAANIAVVA
jgi:hypothetical protein